MGKIGEASHHEGDVKMRLVGKMEPTAMMTATNKTGSSIHMPWSEGSIAFPDVMLVNGKPALLVRHDHCHDV